MADLYSPTEIMLMHPELFGLQSATHVQRAICRASDGYPMGALWDVAAVREAFGGLMPASGKPPKMVLDIGAIRTGKSLKAAAIATARAQLCDVSRILPGEQGPRVAICSTSLDNAKIVFGHLSGHIMNSPRLAPLIVAQTADSITLRHPSGIPVEIKVIASARSGSSLVGRWLAGVVFDEATLMLGSSDGRVRDLDADLLQLEGRMLPGAQIVMIGSTVAPPRGPCHRLLHEHWGKTSDSDVVAIWSTGPEAHPDLYTPEYVAALAPEVREVTTKRVFLDPGRTWLDATLIDANIRQQAVLQPDDAATYVVATDPATRTNAWSVIVLGCYPTRPKYRVALACEWVPKPGAPLQIPDTMGKIGSICRDYQTPTLIGDKHLVEVMSDAASEEGIEYVNSDMRRDEYTAAYLELHRLLTDRDLELPPVENLRADLQRIKKIVSPRGGIAFEITPPGAGRHCDYVPALLRAIANRPEAPEMDEPMETELARMERLEIGRASHGLDAVFGRLT